jgi:LuxR family transcriptional regulator, maltose regulon positive regulatory protein
VRRGQREYHQLAAERPRSFPITQTSRTHVALTTRADPPLPLASVRAHNRLLEIDASELGFDLQETREFLEHEKPGSLELADAELLHCGGFLAVGGRPAVPWPLQPAPGRSF